ncbi:MAG: hypothetical protein LC689_16390 [Myxococcales bacterium]|nr:hypothetical protein [Myxococcales bacterium]
MGCIEITVVVLSISICRPQARPQQLPGRWVGALESRVLRAELTPGPTGLTGVLRLEGGRDLMVVRAGESSSRVYLETDELVFVGVLRSGSIVGRVYRGSEELSFELHRDEMTTDPPRGRSSRRRWPDLIRLMAYALE